MNFNKKGALILGSALLSVALLAQPTLAASNQGINCIGVQQLMNWGKMHSIMNSGVMQQLHDSPSIQQAMQEAMKSGDFTKMREVMNSSEVRAQLGDDFVNRMLQMMNSTYNGTTNMSHMMDSHSSPASGYHMSGSHNSMMNRK